ncbi:Quinoprotein amine dehydrogenase beta chain-like [Trinorchestia longiramus]|nr:Quinoprotein amine dehydrogenase beta chain-like [Trinorchestia longiramus]
MPWVEMVDGKILLVAWFEGFVTSDVHLKKVQKRTVKHRIKAEANGETKEVIRWTDQTTDVRTRVHEYGGGSFLVHNGTAFFVSGGDHQVYRVRGPMGVPEKVTDSPSKRYADFTYSPKSERLYCVFEDHGPVKAGKSKEPKNGIAVLDMQSGREEVMFCHADFFASPRVTSDGTRLVWIQWNHPQMPWDTTKLYAGSLSEKVISDVDVDTYLQQGR